MPLTASPGAGQDSRAPILLYDGVCGFCNASVQFLLRHERQATLRFAALHSAAAGAVLARHPHLRGVDSVVWVDRSGAGERVLVRSGAALAAIAYLGGPWKLLLACRVVPRPVRDFLYDLFARHRYRFFGKLDRCPLPPPALRARFLDDGMG